MTVGVSLQNNNKRQPELTLNELERLSTSEELSMSYPVKSLEDLCLMVLPLNSYLKDPLIRGSEELNSFYSKKIQRLLSADEGANVNNVYDKLARHLEVLLGFKGKNKKRRVQITNSRIHSINEYYVMKQWIKDLNLIKFAARLNVIYNYNFFDVDVRANSDMDAFIQANPDISEIAKKIRNSFPRYKESFEKPAALDLSYLNLTLVPEEISYFTNLQELNLSNNKITKVPSFDENLRLIFLNLSKNNLESIPETCLKNNTNLERLNLSNNKLISLPQNFLSNSLNLEYLNLSNNKLISLPQNFLSNNPRLFQLNLSYNKLRVFPQNFLSNNPFLRALSIQKNQIEQNIGALRNRLNLQQFNF